MPITKKPVTQQDLEQLNLTWERRQKDAQFDQRCRERENGRTGAWIIFWFFGLGLLQMLAQMFWGRDDVTENPEFFAGICFAAVVGSLCYLGSHPKPTHRD